MGPITLVGGHSLGAAACASLFLTHDLDGAVDRGVGTLEAVEDPFPNIGAHGSHSKLVHGHEGVGVAADVLCSEPIMGHDMGDRCLDGNTRGLGREQLAADRRHGVWCVRVMFDLTPAPTQEQFIHILGPQGVFKKR